MMTQINRIILVPGLFEPRFALAPLRSYLQNRWPRVDVFRDRIAFRDLDQSVARLAAMIAGGDDEQEVIGIVTHSFGDWIARQAIARSAHHRVAALVSLAPAMSAGLLPIGLYCLSGNTIPEIGVLMEPSRALANLDCDRRVHRLVIWAKTDESVRETELHHLPEINVERVVATHLTVIFQPNVMRMIHEFLSQSGLASMQRSLDSSNDGLS